MRILITGGTGLIGRQLCQLWLTKGYEPVVLSRNPKKAGQINGPGVQGIASLEEVEQTHFDAVINLAGAPIADKPWSTERRNLLRQSRIDLTYRLVEWLARQPHRPEVLISGSAVGWYGNGGDSVLDEHSPQQSHDFATELCADWEAAALRAEALGLRVALVRTGLVLTDQGGFLSRLVPLFKFGLGGKQGTGQQWMPWVHVADEVGIIDFLLHHTDLSGPFNACAPNPVRNAEFAKALAQRLHRPAVLTAPAFALKAAMGDMAELILGGQRLLPTRIVEAGYVFQYPDLQPALSSLEF